MTASTASRVEVEQLAQRRRVGSPPGAPASSLTRTVGACSSLSTTRRTVWATPRGCGSRSPAGAVEPGSSASTTSAAIARSATTVGATRAALLGER